MKSVNTQIRGGSIYNSRNGVIKPENQTKLSQVRALDLISPITWMRRLISLKLSPEAEPF